MSVIERGLLMPGLGSQYVTMGKELYDAHRIVQERFEEANDCLNMNFVKLVFAASDVDIQSFEQGPLALFVVQAASASLLDEAQIPVSGIFSVDVVSFYGALYAARVLSLPDALYLIKKLIDIAQAYSVQQGIVASYIHEVRPDVIEMVRALCEQSSDRGVPLSFVRAEQDKILVSGTPDGVAYLEEKLQAQEIPFARSSHIDLASVLLPADVVAQFVMYFEKVDIRDAAVKVVHPVSGAWLQASNDMRQALQDILTQPVRGDVVVQQLASFVEGVIALPAQKVAEKVLLSTPAVTWYTMETEAEWQQLVAHAAPPEIAETLLVHNNREATGNGTSDLENGDASAEESEE